jgi:cysteine synthase A
VALRELLEDSALRQLIGQTPLVRLRQLPVASGSRIFAKMESMNVGGSIKDRSAYALLVHGISRDLIDEGTLIVESSSGNMGIGMAQICAVLSLRFVCVVDARTTRRNMQLLRAYGAEVVVVDHLRDPADEFLPARIRLVEQIVAAHPNAYWPNQYANQASAAIHMTTTMQEIASALEGPPDYLYCATSTCATLRGCLQYVAERSWPTRVIAVDAVGSRIFADAPDGVRVLPGMGAALRPALAEGVHPAEVIYVSDDECAQSCRELLRTEGLLVGPSSGAVVTAARRVAARSPGAELAHVIICPDRGDRYLDGFQGTLTGAIRHVEAADSGTRA